LTELTSIVASLSLGTIFVGLAVALLVPFGPEDRTIFATPGGTRAA